MKPILITAGATHNPIDVMRSITAHASGKTGAQIALALKNTTLLGSALACEHLIRRSQESSVSPPPFAHFGSTRHLQKLMHEWIEQNPAGIVIHSAAVGDYECEQISSNKISSKQDSLILKLIPAPKILSGLQHLSKGLKIVSFKAASPNVSDDELRAIAQKQLEESQSAMVFANRLGSTDKDIIIVLKSGHRKYTKRSDAIQALIEQTTVWQQSLV